MGAIVLIDRHTTNGDDEALRSLPHEYAVSARGEYAHLPRAATRYGRGHLSVSMMCGMTLNNPILTDEPGGPVCATCHGRQLGLAEHPFAYRPQTWFHLPARWCKSLGYADIGDRMARCLSCGWIGGTWYSGGPYGGSVSMRRHEHGGRGVLCPDHGRQWLYAGTNVIVCGHFKCEHPPIVRFATDPETGWRV